LTGSAIERGYIQAEGKADRLSARLMAVVAEGQRSRVYLSATRDHETTAALAETDPVVEESRATFLSPPTPTRAMITGGVCSAYGLRTYGHLFTPRQLVALTTFSDLVGEARARALRDARAAGLSDDPTPLHAAGQGATAYADAVATYLAFALNRSADRGSSICSWDSSPKMEALRNTFARQALPMTWDFAEGNPFSESSGNFIFNIEWTADAASRTPASGKGAILNIDAPKNSYPIRPGAIASDPPYYDNIGYADLSDYFYVWLRRSISNVWPDLFRRLTTPKAAELVATPYRFDDPAPPAWAEPDLRGRWPALSSKERAEAFFMNGMSDTLKAMGKASTDCEPLTIYYAFKQSEVSEDGVTSAGWSSFLQAVVDAGLSVDGTWPIRTELSNRMIGKGANALASSVVLVCRKRGKDAPVTDRAGLMRALKREMPEAIDKIRAAGVGPVDMQQSVIGPGMGVFSRYARVLENDDSEMSVKTALSLINRVWEEIENELDAAFDAETQVALAWFASYGTEIMPSGELTTLANAKNIPDKSLFDSGVFDNLHGKTRLTAREAMPKDWTPATDRNLTVWECVQHVARVLNAEDGGGEAAARLVAQMGGKAADAQKLAYRLYEIANAKGWAAEARVYNELAQEWADLESRAAETPRRAERPAQAAMDF
jgi:putative DNA methylase